MSPWMVVVMMVVSGGVMAFQAPINHALKTQVGIFESSLISFSVGTLALILIVALTRAGNLGNVRNASWWHLLGGLIGALFVTATLLAAPKIGVTGMMVAGLSGSMAMALAIDRFGWVGMPAKPLDLHRVAGVVLLAAAMILINWNTGKRA